MPDEKAGDANEKEEKQPPKKRGKIEKQRKNSKPISKPAQEQSSTESEDEEKAKKKSKGKKRKSENPRTVDMIIEAIENLDERNGSSVQAIKSYIIENYKVRDNQLKSMLKKALENALKTNLVIRPKNQANTTISGRFLTGRYMIGKKTEEVEPRKPRPAQLRQFNVLEGKKKGKKTTKKKRRRKAY